jgi:hypothetical protein
MDEVDDDAGVTIFPVLRFSSTSTLVESFITLRSSIAFVLSTAGEDFLIA